MINVTIENFETEVIEASMHTPVLVDFWAPWCGPCKVIGPLLEKIEADYQGRFKLVKIDSDQEQVISQAFGIRSIPTCVLMVGGNIAGVTRNIPTAIALETSKGEFAQGIALGFVLLVVALSVNFALAFAQGEGGMK